MSTGRFRRIGGGASDPEGRHRKRRLVPRVAVIADTHLPRGTRRIPDDCLRRLAAADLILHAGDVVAASVLDELAQLGPLRAVHGNMDETALRDSLPRELVVEVGGARIGMAHVPGPRAGRKAGSRRGSRAATPSSTGTRTCRRWSGTAPSGS